MDDIFIKMKKTLINLEKVYTTYYGVTLKYQCEYENTDTHMT